ncbi:hypothetical protein [Plantibacter sp. YIM 135347]|uniref:hypothetical protein n=1 Tax=Plantibacter sp. YIM 135347 TaxID=3423919 RepID=UPI003D34E5AE
MQPVVLEPTSHMFDLFKAIETPALVYDLENLRHTLASYIEDIALVPTARLNIAVKATHTPDLLKALFASGVGADVASVREFMLAQEIGFTEISATGPSFTSARDFQLLADAGITLDVDSLDQLRAYGAWRPGGPVGLRIRVPHPASLNNANTFGANSRFGVTITDASVRESLAEFNLSVTRLHMHTGQMSPASLVHKIRYTLAIAKTMPTIGLIDLGGGFFDLFVSRITARAALLEVRRLLEAWETETGRALDLRFEPGGAVLAPHGYLLTRVDAIELEHPYYGRDVVQVDSSAWNCAPWHKPEVVHLNAAKRSSATADRILAGNTLYENDFFGTAPDVGVSSLAVPDCEVGDVLVLTNSGAYTSTNARDFNLLGRLREYAFDGSTIRPIGQWLTQ